MKADVTGKDHAMTDDTHDLARRAVACEGWQWMEGMRTADTDEHYAVRVTLGGDCPKGTGGTLPKSKVVSIGDTALPDLSDPATLGCLLELVREAWGDPTITPEYQRDLKQWTISRPHGTGGFGLFDTEAAALVAALEAADE